MENNSIPDRVITDFDPPPAAPMDENLLFPEKESKKKYTPDWKALRDHLSKEGKVSKESCHQILNDTLTMLSKQRVNLGFERLSHDAPPHIDMICVWQAAKEMRFGFGAGQCSFAAL